MKTYEREPVVIRREIEIFAPPRLVWEWISRVELWSDWHPEVSSSQWLGDPGPDGRFKLRINLLGFDAVVTSWREEREFAWAGQSWLTTTRQVFRIDGDFRSTTVVCEQTLDGLGARVLAPLLQRVAGRWSEVLLGALKTRIEGAHERASNTQRQRSAFPRGMSDRRPSRVFGGVRRRRDRS